MNATYPWNRLVASLPNPHFLQSQEWAQVKAKYGWEPLYAVWREKEFSVSSVQPPAAERSLAAALILKKQILNRGFAARLSILYAPKGPLLDWKNAPLRKRVLNDLQAFAKQQGAIFLKMDPDVVLARGIPGAADEIVEEDGQAVKAELNDRGWVDSREQIQFRNTVLIDLSATEEEALARMKPKTRYNIRLAERKGVSVRMGTLDDLPALYKMYAETSVRDGFVIRDENYYMTVWRLFMQRQSPPFELHPSAFPLIAEIENEPAAALFLFMFAGRAYYVYGMSRNVHREKMPTYLLQWEAMKRAKACGCKGYDLWGAPEVFDESDSLWGVYRFKEGLGGEVARTLGAYDFVPNKLWYKLYAEIMPRLLDMMRSRGKVQTRQALG